MTTTNTSIETSGVRELSATEIGDVSGAISLGTWFRRLAWHLQNAPENSVLEGCSDDMISCSWQGK